MMANVSIFKSQFRVYYEDTDAGGVVYYANYLKFAERARTEMLRDKDINQTELAQQQNILFVVKRGSFELHAPARLDDLIAIETQITEAKGARLSITQNMLINEEPIAEVRVEVACVSSELKPKRLPESLKL